MIWIRLSASCAGQREPTWRLNGATSSDMTGSHSAELCSGGRQPESKREMTDSDALPHVGPCADRSFTPADLLHKVGVKPLPRRDDTEKAVSTALPRNARRAR